MFQSAGRITIPGNRVASWLGAAAYTPVSIRRADHDTWELHIVAAIGGGTLVSIRRADHDTWEPTGSICNSSEHKFQSAGRITIPGNEQRYTPGCTTGNVSIRRADHDTWERHRSLCPRFLCDSFNPPGGSRYLGTDSAWAKSLEKKMFQSAGRITIPGNPPEVPPEPRAFPFQSAGRITIPGNAPIKHVPHPQILQFQSAGRITIPGNSSIRAARSSSRRRFNPPGGSRYLGTFRTVWVVVLFA